MTVRADGSPRVYLPYLSNRGGQRPHPRRYGKDLFKPSLDNHMAQAYYDAQQSTRPEPRFPYTATENARFGGRTSGVRRDSNLPSIHKPQPTIESPRRRKTWSTRQGRGAHNNGIPKAEDTPRKRGSWVVPDSEDMGPRLYNPQRSKLRNVPLPNLTNPRENMVGYDENVYSSNESITSSRRKQWSRPSKNVDMVIEGNGSDNENEIPADNIPYSQYDRNVTNTSMFETKYGRVPINDMPNDYYNYKHRNAKTKVPNNKTTESQFGLTRTPEDKAVVFEPNVFGNSYQEMVYPSHYGEFVRSTRMSKARPVMEKKTKADVSVRSQSRIQSLSARDPSLDLSRSYSEIPKGMKRTAQSVPLSVKLERESERINDTLKSDDTRPAKYTHTVEEPKLVTSEDFRPAKYTYTKEEKEPSDNARPAKYTYTISTPPAKERIVSFKDDVAKSDERSEATKNQTITSNPNKQNGILKSGLQNSTENVLGRNSVSKSSLSNASLVRKSWSPPVEEYDDPRKFWVDIGANSDDSKHAKKPRGSRTPRKSKRMAAKLDGHSSTETDNSKSITDSADHKPPVHQMRGSKEPHSGDKEVEEVSSPVDSKAAGLKVEDSMLGTQDSDDIPMLQKLKEMNQNAKDQKRKKDVPKWLKQEEVPGPFENPVDSQPNSKPEEMASPGRPSSDKRPGSDRRQSTGEKDTKQGMKDSRPDSGRRPGSEKGILPTKDHMKQTHQEDVDMLIDEELAMNWPEKGVPHLNTVFDKEKVVEKAPVSKSSTPMQKIQQNRAKWRDNQKKNLEESWGQLNMFDRHQKGRISVDLDDDALDEYLQPSKKTVPQPSIKEEEDDDEKAALAAVEEELDMDNFVIPELPYGRELVIDIKTTWGDRHYVGLTGIELFSSTGESVTATKIHANPLDINILNEYEKDPRVINNLIDGVNRTRDDVHMWLAPFTPNAHHYIYITFEKACKISLMRIWNYNKSRIHSYRGAKDVVVTLDGTEIFKGEIARACGGIEGGTEAFGDTILFTTDETILEAVSKNDDAYEGDLFSDDEPDDVPFERPSTADQGSDDERPFTRAAGNLKKAEKEAASIPPRPATSMVTEGDVIVFRGKRLELNFTATWGDLHYLGLTGIEVVGKEGEALPVNLNMITATPKDLHHLPGHERDDRTLDKVIDGTNVTMSDEHMWLIPFQEGNDHTFVIDFPQTQLMAGLRIWNYNKSPEDTYRGAKIVHVTIDGKQLSPSEGYLIRKGPGNCHFDYAQEISFAPQQQKTPSPSYPVKGDSVRSSVSDDPVQEYESMQMPCGFIYQLQLISTWGDQYYVGLNGLEFFDAMHNRIELTENNISAYPDSINVLSNMQNDVRTPDKLIDSVNSTTDGRHMWLAPILPSILNRVYVIFDQPTAISMIKIWNYSKTPGRGAKDFALLVDDLLVYNGMLSSVRQGARGILPTADAPQSYHTIIFTDNKDIIKKEKHSIISNQAGEQDIQLTNDKQVVSHYNDPKKAQQGKPVNQELRPKTSVTGMMKKRR